MANAKKKTKKQQSPPRKTRPKPRAVKPFECWGAVIGNRIEAVFVQQRNVKDIGKAKDLLLEKEALVRVRVEAIY